MSTPLREQASPAGCLFRLFWFFAGNVLLAFLGIQLFFRNTPTLSRLDSYYWLVALFILAARYADVRYCEGATTDGQQATLKDWKQHAITLILSASLAWGLSFLKAWILPG